MIRYDKRVWILGAALSALAGYVDAIAFVELGGFFVSFMSGNSTRLGVGLSQALSAAGIASSLVGAFVAGVIAGTITGRFVRSQRSSAVLALVAVSLAGAALLGGAGAQMPAALFMAAAMGAENAIFEREGEVTVGLTYMTGTLVKLGQRLAAAMMGGPRLAWLPYLLLWAGLVGGAAAGALAHSEFGIVALWAAAAAAALLAPIANWLAPN